MKYPASPLTPFLATLPCIRRRMRILREQRQPKGLDQLSAHTSIACALLNSLLALFSAPVLSFQWLAHSFAKTPGVGVSRTVLRATRVGRPSATPPRSLRLCGIICSGLGRSFVFITLQIPPFPASINMPRLFTKLQIPPPANSFFSHRYKTAGCHPIRTPKPSQRPLCLCGKISSGLPVLS